MTILVVTEKDYFLPEKGRMGVEKQIQLVVKNIK